MLRLRLASQRGLGRHGWLDSAHTFSFADYYDPQHMGFRSLRVINEDRVRAGAGFGTHPHRNMEILSYVLAGSLQHRDSLGNGAILRPGELQRITAGTGILHSEFNPDAQEPVHFYQIWLLPQHADSAPSWQQKAFDPLARRDRLQLVASPEGNDDSLTIGQDARVYLADLSRDAEVVHEMRPSRHAWVQVLRGTVGVGEWKLQTGDGLAVSEEKQLLLRGQSEAEILLFDLA
jgi:hypothetical protein